MNSGTAAAEASLGGLRVLVPRGGELGSRLAAAVTARGGDPVVAPVIEFTAPDDRSAFSAACARLSAGEYDWVAVTSATTVDSLVRERVLVPSSTRVAAVGEATGEALAAAGIPVHFVPGTEHSAAGMIAEWPDASGRVLIPQSEIAESTLADGLAGLGMIVETVTAYRTVPVALDPAVVELAAAGMLDGILLTSSSVAREVARQCSPLATNTVVACIGQSTAATARSAGLEVHAVARTSSADSLVSALADYRATHAPGHTTNR